MAESSLSERGYEAYINQDRFLKFFLESYTNEFHPTKNKEGLINLGTASNYLVAKELEERLQNNVLNFSSHDHQHYYPFDGKGRIKEAVADFFNRHFKPVHPVEPNQLTIMAGTTSCLDAVAFTIFDEGDCFLTPAPFYGQIHKCMNAKSKAIAIPFNVSNQNDEDGDSFTISPAALEDRIIFLREGGVPLKGLVLISPHNPLGDVYDAKLLREILDICAKYTLHVVVNEIYALSVHDPNVEFTSVLSLKDLPDPDRTHHIWSFSKDIGMSGIRCGTIYSRNTFVCEALYNIAQFHCVPSIIQDMCASILNDSKWLDETFLPLNKKRLYEQYNYTVGKLALMGINVRPSKAGLFIWANLQPFLSDNSKAAEIELFNDILDAGLYVIPGTLYHCTTPGWFRIVFTAPRVNLDEGLARLRLTLKNKRNI